MAKTIEDSLLSAQMFKNNKTLDTSQLRNQQKNNLVGNLRTAAQSPLPPAPNSLNMERQLKDTPIIWLFPYF